MNSTISHFRNYSGRDVLMKIISISGILLVLFNGCVSEKDQESNDSIDTPPNIVLIFLDDAGFADFQPFAETRYSTPNVDKLAEEGRSFYNFYVPQAICSASRAALMTGTYPERNGLFSAHAPRERGLDPQFKTMGEILQRAGYTTGFFGKWHMGDQPETRPQQRGFDEVSGIMYSNDMWADHPVNPEFWGQYPLQYWENDEVVIDSVTAEDQTNFTTWFTEDSVDFIHRNSDQPFFLYLPHPMPHVPHTYRISEGGRDGLQGENLQGQIDMSLFDMIHDPYEKVNVIDDYPEVAERMLRFAESHEKKFFDKY